jgi:fatty acid/phospholipid biosynthesis enzyme
MRIGIDAMGGDFAPFEAVKGSIAAKKLYPESFLFFLAGKMIFPNVLNNWEYLNHYLK